MENYVNRLNDERFFQSMSLKATCMDTSVMDNFFGMQKQEIYYGHTFHSCKELGRIFRHYITFYNTHGIKAKLGWLSLVDYRLRHTTG